jgi:hypothetical protein
LRKPVRTGRAEIDVDDAAHTNSSGAALFLCFTKTALDTNKQKLTHIKLIKRVNIGKGRDLCGGNQGVVAGDEAAVWAPDEIDGDDGVGGWVWEVAA